MIKHYQISATELDLDELVNCLTRIEERLIHLESLAESHPSSLSGRDELMTRDEVSHYFKVNVSTVRNWTKQDILKKYSVGNRVYYKRSEVEAAPVLLNR